MLALVLGMRCMLPQVTIRWTDPPPATMVCIVYLPQGVFVSFVSPTCLLSSYFSLQSPTRLLHLITLGPLGVSGQPSPSAVGHSAVGG